jgi:hypothetical protein
MANRRPGTGTVPDHAVHPTAEHVRPPNTRFSGGTHLGLAAACALAILSFGLAYGQSPLYTSNQNQYFLHGAARAGIGFLSEDWLANTADPTPVFSWVVEWTYRLLPPEAFYVEYLLLFGVYLAGLWLLGDALLELRTSGTRALLFLALIVVLHSAALRVVQGRLLGGTWEYLWDGGVASQRLLGTVFQPSSFGVLLLLSVGLFAQGKTAWACASAALAACVHPTYLLPAAILVLAYCLVTWGDTRSLRRPVRFGLLALTLVTPIVLYVAINLGPTGPDNFAEAQRILVQQRVPHHALPEAWLDATVIVKLTLIGLALIVARSTHIGRVLALAGAAGLLLTGLQAFTGSATLALLFPWRISAVLVPASVGLLSGWIARRATSDLHPMGKTWQHIVSIGCVTAVFLLAAAGMVGFLLQRAERSADPAAGMIRFVGEHTHSGEVYLIPAALQEFRLATGAPALVDRKSIPYLDVDVIEWSDRMRLAGWFYRELPAEVDCSLLDTLSDRYGVTHVVLDEALLNLTCARFHEVYRDAHYAVHALASP